jgi:hypothetical protein
MKTLLPVAALLLAACGPVYRTNYELFPPADLAGQTCVANVKLMSDTCEANCRQMSRNCRSNGSGVSIGYGYGRYGGNYETVMGNRQLLDDRDCNDTQCVESCLATARQAHLNCGGTIKSEVVCTANCPAPNPAP